MGSKTPYAPGLILVGLKNETGGVPFQILDFGFSMSPHVPTASGIRRNFQYAA
jgi:hypothetical protein